MAGFIDPVELAAAMMRRPSITPFDAGALDVLQEALEGLGFTCHRLPFAEDSTEEVDNLYARRGTNGRNFCFAGHTDVIPPAIRTNGRSIPSRRHSGTAS